MMWSDSTAWLENREALSGGEPRSIVSAEVTSLFAAASVMVQLLPLAAGARPCDHGRGRNQSDGNDTGAEFPAFELPL